MIAIKTKLEAEKVNGNSNLQQLNKDGSTKYQRI